MPNNDMSAEQLAQLIQHQQEEKRKAQEKQINPDTPFVNLRAPEAEWSLPFELTEKPEPEPELIEGLFLEGGVQQLVAPSKGLKTSDTLQKAICLALGIDYMNRKTFRPRKVLVVNVEMRRKQYERRFFDVCEALFPGFPKSMPEELKENLVFLHLKGTSIDTLNKLCNEIYKHKNDGFEVLFIDPIYNIFQGDENSASDWSRGLTMLDKLGKRLNLTIFYSHHFGKSNESNKETLELGAGSGVKERRADDTESRRELYIPQQIRTAKEWDKSVRAFEVEHTIRDYFGEPQRVYYKYPLFYPDTDGALRGLPEIGSSEAKRLKQRDQASELESNPYMNLREALSSKRGKGKTYTAPETDTTPSAPKETTKQREKRETKASACAMHEIFSNLGKDTLTANELASELERIAKEGTETHSDLPIRGAQTYRKKTIPAVIAMYPKEFYIDESGKIHEKSKQPRKTASEEDTE